MIKVIEYIIEFILMKVLKRPYTVIYYSGRIGWHKIYTLDHLLSK